MAGEDPDVFRRVKHEIHVADIDGRPPRPEDGERHRVPLPAVEQEPAKGGIEFVEQGGHGAELRRPALGRQALPDTLAAGEILDRLQRAAGLHVGLRPPAVGEPLLGLLDAHRGHPAAVFLVFVADDLLGLEQVGQGCRHIADLVARGLGVPAGQALVGRRGGAGFDLQRRNHEVGAELAFLAQAQQPVDADLLALGDGGDGLGARQALVALRQQLGQRGAVQPHSGGEGHAAQSGTLDHLGQALAKHLHGFAPVHRLSSLARTCGDTAALGRKPRTFATLYPDLL